MNKKIKLLSLGILSSVIISATPVCAANVHNSKVYKPSVVENNVKIPTMPGTEKPSTFTGQVISKNGTDLKASPNASSKTFKHLPLNYYVRIQYEPWNDSNPTSDYVYVHCLDTYDMQPNGLCGYVLRKDLVY